MIRFPKSFVWGTASAAYQIEGAAAIGGRGPSIWDVFSKTPGKTYQGQSGDVACDHYHRFEEDLDLMKAMGMKAYRFSISWSRVIPLGRGEVNEEGVAFYNQLIDGLAKRGIVPWVTLFHWDLPQALQEDGGGLLNPAIQDAFVEYADLCFSRFGDRVANWITLNEPWCSAVLGHGQGYFAPGHASVEEPYVSAHNLILSHGRIVQLYRSRYQAAQGGAIGITNNCDWREPASALPEDQEAAQRALEFFMGWFADPVYFGDYPASMRERVGERLPVFTAEESAMLKGSSDFFGLNHYTTMLAASPGSGHKDDIGVNGNGGMIDDQHVELFDDPAWKKTHMGWNIVPWGCRKLLQWIDQRYDRPPIYITENGCAMPGEDDRDVAINDAARVSFLSGYLSACSEAIESGVDLRGYFCWTFMDNFEWAHGYSKRFGIHWVDFATGERVPKTSAKWLAEVFRRNGLEALNGHAPNPAVVPAK